MARLGVLPTRERPLEAVLGLSGAVLELARSQGSAVLVSSLVTSRALVLGGRQSRPSIYPNVTVLRRRTLGTSALLEGRALWHALALPRPDALASDGNAHNVLNRNLRGFLSAYSGSGVRASYPGREYLVLAGRPCALVGYDVYADFAVLLEVVLGIDAPVVVAVSRGRGGLARTPAALAEVAGDCLKPDALAARVEAGFARRFGCTPLPLPEPFPPPGGASHTLTPSAGARTILGERSVPLGQLRASIAEGRFRVEGELLGSSAALERFEACVDACVAVRAPVAPDCLEAFRELPLEGARPEDLLALAQLAGASTLETPDAQEQLQPLASTANPK